MESNTGEYFLENIKKKKIYTNSIKYDYRPSESIK